MDNSFRNKPSGGTTMNNTVQSKLTLSAIKDLCNSNPDSHFFNTDTMRFFRQAKTKYTATYINGTNYVIVTMQPTQNHFTICYHELKEINGRYNLYPIDTLPEKAAKQKFVITTELQFNNPQYYSGHGHAFEKETLLACYEFSEPATGNETIKEIAENIVSNLNEAYFMNEAENNETLQETINNISDKTLTKAITSNWNARTNTKPYNQYYTPNDNSDDETNMYYIGVIHIYEA